MMVGGGVENILYICCGSAYRNDPRALFFPVRERDPHRVARQRMRDPLAPLDKHDVLRIAYERLESKHVKLRLVLQAIGVHVIHIFIPWRDAMGSRRSRHFIMAHDDERGTGGPACNPCAAKKPLNEGRFARAKFSRKDHKKGCVRASFCAERFGGKFLTEDLCLFRRRGVINGRFF